MANLTKILILMMLTLSGCTPWPLVGTGGASQHYLFTPKYANSLDQSDPFYFIYPKLVSLRNRLNNIQDRRMSLCYPAYVAMLEQDIDFAAQQFASGHFDLSLACAEKLKPNVEVLSNLVHKRYCIKNIPQFNKYRRNPCDA